MGQENSKEKFRQLITTLNTRTVDDNAHPFWNGLFTGWKDEDVYHILTPEDIREIREKQPGNLATFLFKCIEQVVLFQQQEHNTDQLSIKNSMSYLTRILPILFEHDDDDFIERFFVLNLNLAKEAQKQKRKKMLEDENIDPTFFPFNPVDEKDFQEKLKKFSPKKGRLVPPPRVESITVGVEQNEERKEVSKEINGIMKGVENREKPDEKLEKNESRKEKETVVESEDIVDQKKKKEKNERSIAYLNEPSRFQSIGNTKLTCALSKKLIHVLLESLFLPGFTLPMGQVKPRFRLTADHPKTLDPNLLWAGGVGVPAGHFYPTTMHVSNRKLVLKCILACCSRSLYVHQDNLDGIRNSFLSTLVDPKAPYTANLFFSLLNVVSQYNPTGTLPYTSVLFADASEEMALYSIQALALCLTCPTKKNAFRGYIAGIKNKRDMKVLFNIFNNLLRKVVDSDNTYLPGSQKGLLFVEEMFVVLWKFMEYNHAFRFFSCKEMPIERLVVSLLYILNKHSKDRVQFPFLQVIAFTLLLLSEERECAVRLNRKFVEKLPGLKKLPLFEGNHLDFLVLLIFKIIAEDKDRIIKPLLNCLMTVIYNVSPYAKTMCITSAVKLLTLFDSLVNPLALFDNQQNHDLLVLMLHTLNNIIQYQFDGNHNVIYAILRRKEKFSELTEPVDIEEVKLKLKERRERLQEKGVIVSNFVPTEDWLMSWRPNLPLQTITSMLRSLVPEVENFCKENSATEEDVLKFLSNTTLVGLLPVPHNIVIRTFKTNNRIEGFLSTFVWGLIYVKGLNYIPYDVTLYDSTKIKLFTVKPK